MGCATQELTAAASQQQTEKLPPSQTTGSTYQLPTNNGPTLTKLKQSHSALVKLLESAPISTPAPSSPANTNQQQHHQLEVAVDHTTTTSSTTNQHHHYRKKMVKLLEHIKSNSSDSDISKSLQSSSSQKVISDNVKCVSNVSQMCPDKGPISCSGSEEDDAKTVAPLPWKKTRLAREWRQKKQQEETPTVVVSPPPTTQTETTADTQQASAPAVQPMDTDEEDVDMCEHHILENLYHNDNGDHICRRNSLESCSDGGGHNDSGCDSDCPDNNINELCKRFDENLTDEDVCVVRHRFFNHF
jgi:hypothetical protein